MDETTKVQKPYDIVLSALNYAKTYELETEVITEALVYLKENPDASIIDALDFGLHSWDL